ncbi:MAG: sigE [Verrucomicrobiaceae bacterium]|nr:sigE [Verrucomicrobiaceae bacterium]
MAEDLHPPDRTQAFLELLTQHDRALGVYVYSLVQGGADADDILQQTKLILWRCFDQFEAGTNFLAWARKTAFHQILTYRRQTKRVHLPLSEETLQALHQEVERLGDMGDARRDALRACLAKLPPEHRQLVTLRYFEDLEIEQIAERIRTTVAAVYRALSRVRFALLGCVEKEMSKEAA